MTLYETMEKSFIYRQITIRIMGKIIKIYEALLNRKEKICHRADIIEIAKEYNKHIGKKINQ